MISIIAIVIIGGLTRLTDSGLSMVTWKPLQGIFPPLNEEQWANLFFQYQDSPEFRIKNNSIQLSQFKSIFWWEYTHRMMGRLIGLIVCLPYLLFVFKNRFNQSQKKNYSIIIGLVALQGLIGWFMVKSGLSDQPDVSHYRLTAHLAVAIVLYAYLFWIALEQLRGQSVETLTQKKGLRWIAVANIFWLFLTMLAGGLVAGLDAGFTYNTFPLMDGKLTIKIISDFSNTSLGVL